MGRAGSPRRWFGSATWRLVALIFVLQALVIGGVLFYARLAIAQQVSRDQQDFVAEVEADLRAWHRRGGDTALAAEIRTRLASLKGENLLLLFAAADGRVMAGNLNAWPPVVPRSSQWRTIDLYRTGGDRVERIGVSAVTLPNGAHLLIGRVIESDLKRSAISERVLLAAFLLALPLSLLVALAMTRVINSRITGIADTANAVGTGDLARRVPLDGSGDAFDRLGHGVNAMLARIETLVGELRVVTGSLAHDLRAPIFRITATLDQAMQQTSDSTALAAMERVSIEAGILQRMLATAMQISQAEAGIGRHRFAEVDVTEMLTGIAELYEFASEEQGLALRVESDPVRFRLHFELVGQALGNLIDNAMKYADGASAIVLSGSLAVDGSLRLIVADNGAGIAAADREQAVRRFGRLDPSRHTSGAGLGLALVEAVARLHNGDVALEDNQPGLRVVIRLGAA